MKNIDLAKYGLSTYLFFDFVKTMMIVFIPLAIISCVTVYFNAQEQGLGPNLVRTYIELTTFANQPTITNATKAKDTLFYLQVLEALSILIFLAGTVYYHLTVRKKIMKAANIFPNPSIYSLRIDKNMLSSTMSSEDFSKKFLNTDNIAMTGLNRDFFDLPKEIEKLYALDRRIKQMEIDLSPEPHIAKKGGCMK